MITRTFGSFTFEEVYELYGVEREDTNALLEEWMNVIPIISDNNQENLIRLKTHLFKQVLNWNEDELKMFFIGPLIELADLETKDFKPFTQRTLETTISQVKITGKVDFLISKGLRTAKPPIFAYMSTSRKQIAAKTHLGNCLLLCL